MRVTLLGHATVLVEISGRNFLIDPVLFETCAEGALVPCPRRRVDLGRLPRVDAVVLSQSEPDHFDIPSLAKLPRDRLVVCPQDEMIVYALDRLGFKNVRPVVMNSLLKLGACELLTTPSSRNNVEFGVALKDASGSFWHQVDSAPTSDMFAHVRNLFGPVDLLFASFAPQQFAYFGSQRAGYPATEVRNAVERIKRLGPRMVVPASAGIRLNGPFDWVNAFAFPVSARGFLAQLELLAPQVPRAHANPGDVFDIMKASVVHRVAQSRAAVTVEDDAHRVEFDPSSPVPPLTDPNIHGYPSALLRDTVRETFSALADFVRGCYADDDPVVAALRRRRLNYAVSAVFPDGTEQWLRIDLLESSPVCSHGDGRARGAVTTHRTAASLITAVVRAEHAYSVTGGLARLSLISPADLTGDRVVIAPHEPRDLLIEFLSRPRNGGLPMWRRQLDRQLAPYCAR